MCLTPASSFWHPNKGTEAGIWAGSTAWKEQCPGRGPMRWEREEEMLGCIMSLLRALMVAYPLWSLHGADLKGVFVKRVLQNSCVFLKFSLLQHFAKTSCKTSLFCRKKLGRPECWNAWSRFQRVLQQLTQSVVANGSEPYQLWMKTRANFKLILCWIFLFVWPQGAVCRSF